MGLRCFFLAPLDGRVRIWLRRYAASGCPGNGGGYHNGQVLVAEDAPERIGTDAPTVEELADPRWPVKCGHCEFVFSDEAVRQIFVRQLYRRSDTGELTTILDAPVGAMWYADWMSDSPACRGPDGHTLVARCPDGHDWIIDGVANNCTDPAGGARGDHKCWVRHGEPPLITVDKNGVTCGAGAGSIQTPSWHGFLRNGEFVT